jgi:hypothetical protein
MAEEGYFIREITGESGKEVAHLARVPADERERRSVEKTLKRIGELEGMLTVSRYRELSEKSEFKLNEMDKAELNHLKGTKEVEEYLQLTIDRTLLIGESATMSVPEGKYAVGDVIEKGVAEKEPSFMESRHKLAGL